MSLYNFRIQWPVGQGFFHTGALSTPGVEPWNSTGLLYVYDCGSMKKYGKHRNVAIDAFLSVSGQRIIDFLFISHAHFDHLSGLERLLKSPGPRRVDTIVLPLLSPIQRLIVYSRSISENPGVATQFYRDFAIDPVAALQRFKPRQIIQMVRGNGPAPGADGGPVDGPTDGGPDRDGRSTGRMKWSFIGRGRVSRIGLHSPTSANDHRAAVFEMDDTVGIRVPSQTGRPWLLSTYVDVAVQKGKQKFLAALASSLSMTVSALNLLISNTAGLEQLVLHNSGKLEAAYKSIVHDINVTSLCLYSGPIDQHQNDKWWYYQGFGSFGYDRDRVGWLGTGDAELKTSKRRGEFLKFYKSVFDHVSTLTLPHHGSQNNFHSDLLATI